MSRGGWIAANGLLMVATVLAGWFAANAPEAARPSLNAFDKFELSAEAPPLPPAPYRAAAADPASALERRALFSGSGERGSGAVVAAPPRGIEPLARAVLTGPTAPATAYETPEETEAGDDFRVAMGLEKPRHEQYFGGHLLAPESRDTDPNAYEPADGVAPDYAGKPKINPKRPEAATPIASTPDEGGSSVAATEAPDAGAAEEGAEEGVSVDQAAVDEAGAGAIGGEPEDMILLGVFQSRGAERALVRTATGGNVRVRPGDEIEGWRVSAIGEDNILLRRASKIRVLRLPE